MIWTLENEKYLVTLPSLAIMKEVTDVGQRREFLVASVVNNNIYISSAKEREDNPVEFVRRTDLLKYHKGDSMDRYSVISSLYQLNRKFYVHPMLIPLDKRNQVVSKELREERPNGTFLQLGHLAYQGEEQFPADNPLLDDAHIRDDGKGLELTWTVWEGCLISRYAMFLDTVEAVWKQFYATIPKTMDFFRLQEGTNDDLDN